MGGPPPSVAAPVVPPTEGQTYCLRWNNHQTNLVQILHALHEVGSYVDCTLVVDDDQFKAHRVVLAANSPYFQTILQDVPQDYCSIILPGVKGFEIAALLQYMYTGETTVTKSQEPEILRTAKELQVKGLYDNLMKFNHKDTLAEHGPSVPQPYPSSTGTAPHTPYLATSSSSAAVGVGVKNGGSLNNGGVDAFAPGAGAAVGQHNSSSVISTSTNISPSAAISSSSSPPYSSGAAGYHTQSQPPYAPIYRKSPGPTAAAAAAAVVGGAVEQSPQTAPAAGERGQWPLSPSASAAAAAAMLNSVYESAADMNPLKRKKLSAISSMFMNRDTPILRNVLANPADSSQPSPLLLPGVFKGDKQIEKHSLAHGSNNNQSFNGSDYGSEKYKDEPLSPHTDRSFDDETGGGRNSDKKPEWKRYKQYTRNDMMCAIQCVREGMSALQASRKFGLPSRTLYDKVRKLNINTGRGTGRTPKRSPPSVESSPAFPYASHHNYGQGDGYAGPDGNAVHDEREHPHKEHSSHHQHHHRVESAHHMPPTIPHSAAALLDHAFLQQALENRGGDIAGREALHAMALAAAAHAAANRMSTSPGSNGHDARSPSPSPARYAADELHEKQSPQTSTQPQAQPEFRMIKPETIEREERDADDEDDHVEDLSIARKKRSPSKRPESPYALPPRHATPTPMETTTTGVIVPPLSSKLPTSTNGGGDPASASDDYEPLAVVAKRERELHSEDNRDSD